MLVGRLRGFWGHARSVQPLQLQEPLGPLSCSHPTIGYQVFFDLKEKGMWIEPRFSFVLDDLVGAFHSLAFNAFPHLSS